MFFERRWIAKKRKIFFLMALVVVITWAIGDLLLTQKLAEALGPTAPAAVLLALLILSLGGTWLMIIYLSGEPEYVQAFQSHTILDIANQTLPFLRTGFTPVTAKETARSILEATGAAAVAITCTNKALAFVGMGDDHHLSLGPIMTDGTKQVLREGRVKVLRNKREIGCPVADCPLQSAIIVPFKVREKLIGTLKIYYSHPHRFTPDVIETIESLARLLSTQLELSKIDELESKTHKAELRASQAQINPHFLFNALTTIASLCRTNPAKARSLLILFADFFRKTLEWDDILVTLDQEMDFVNSYLVLEKTRFEDRLEIEVDLAPASRQLRLPPLTIQPLVENAIVHGLKEEGQLKIKVRTEVEADNWWIVVEDNGQGISQEALARVLEPGFGKGLGVGLANIDSRLKTLLGPAYKFKIESQEGEGTKVRLRLPLKMRLAA